MQVSEQRTDLKTYLKINTCPHFKTVDFTFSCIKHKNTGQHIWHTTEATQLSNLSVCLNTGAECHFWLPNDPSWPPATALEWPGLLVILEHSSGHKRCSGRTTLSQSEHPVLQLTRTRISFLTQLLISHEITQNMETSALSCPYSASPTRMLFKSSASSLIVLNFVNDLFWEQLSHETPARQSRLFAQNSKPNHILNTLDFFLSLSTHLCPGLSRLRRLCRFFCTHTLFSLYPYQHASVWLKYMQ